MHRATRVESHCFHISTCLHITMSGPATFSQSGCTEIWRRQLTVVQPTFRNCCLLPECDPEQYKRWLWSPRSCMEPHTASPTPGDSRLRTEERTGILSLYRCVSTTKQYEC